MTATELRAALQTLGWSQRQAAYELQVAPRLMRYWCAGSEHHPIPTVAALAIERLLSNATPAADVHRPTPGSSLRPADP